jgi:hypothetical protein
MTEIERLRCRGCGGDRGRLDMVSVVTESGDLSTAVPLHPGQCEIIYYGTAHKRVRQSNSGAAPARSTVPFFDHPLMRDLRGGPIGGYGYIRSSLTDQAGWMRLTPLSTST